MKYGICTSIANAPAVMAAGWDYIEESVTGLLQGLLPDEEWTGAQRVRDAGIAVPSANVMVPGSLKITGPEANLGALRDYLTRVFDRAQRVGIHTIVFGSGAARNVPDGFDRARARAQIAEYLKMAAPLAAARGVTIVVEPLRRQECNIVNNVSEAMDIVGAVADPAVQCLFDTYHSWSEGEALDSLERNVRSIRHVHVADLEGRVPPGESGKSSYRDVFRVLKGGGYDGLISVEATGFDIPTVGKRVLDYVQGEWNRA